MKSSEPPLSFQKLVSACFSSDFLVGGPCFCGGQFGFQSDDFRNRRIRTFFQFRFLVHGFSASKCQVCCSFFDQIDSFLQI